MKKHYLLTLTGLLLLQTATVRAEDLLTIYQQALAADPKVNAAALQIEISEDQKGQAMGQMFPQINGIANWSTNNQQSEYTQDPNYHGTRYTVSLSQSLIDFTKFWNWRRAQTVVDQVTAENIDAVNNLMFDVVERYFKVLEAADQLYFVQTEKEATEKQLQQVQKQYQKQLLKVTDVYETQARLDKIQADEIEAENILAVAKEGLTELTNKAPENLQKLSASIGYKPLEGKLEDWLAVARSENPSIIAKTKAIEAADDSVTMQQARHLPVVDAQLNYINTNTGYDSRNLFTETDTKVAAINVTVPIFSGGVTSNQISEAKHRLILSKYDHEATSRAVEKETKDAFLSANTNYRRIQAGEKALESATKSRESMEKGFSYGVETVGDVLTARQNEFKAKRDLSQAKYGYITNRVRFLYATGTITEANLQEVNNWLEK